MDIEHVHEHADLQRIALEIRIAALLDCHNSAVRRRQHGIRLRRHDTRRIAEELQHEQRREPREHGQDPVLADRQQQCDDERDRDEQPAFARDDWMRIVRHAPILAARKRPLSARVGHCAGVAAGAAVTAWILQPVSTASQPPAAPCPRHCAPARVAPGRMGSRSCHRKNRRPLRESDCAEGPTIRRLGRGRGCPRSHLSHCFQPGERDGRADAAQHRPPRDQVSSGHFASSFPRRNRNGSLLTIALTRVENLCSCWASAALT